MLIRTIAFCGLAAVSATASTVTSAGSVQLTSTSKSVATLDQVSGLPTPSYFGAERTFENYVLYIQERSAASAAASPSGSVYITGGANLVFETGNASYFPTYEGADSPRQFLNLLAASTTVAQTAPVQEAASPEYSYQAVSSSARSSAASAQSSDSSSSSSSTPPPVAAAAQASIEKSDLSNSASSSVSKYSAVAGSSAARYATPNAGGVSPVPEPSTGIAAGLGAAGLLWLRRRKLKQ